MRNLIDDNLYGLLYGSYENQTDFQFNRCYRIDNIGVRAWAIDRLFLHPGDAPEGAKKDRALTGEDVVDRTKQRMKNPELLEESKGKRINIIV